MKELKFIHITKNAGTSIEDYAKTKGINFGRFHKEYKCSKHNIMSPWHTPINLLPKELQLKYDWFCVVRNPYDRVISEAHCNWTGYHKINPKGFDNVELYNIFIQKMIINRPYKHHWLEQYLYLPTLPDVVCHILKFENIGEEFNALMKSYNLDFELNMISNKSNRVYGINDFSKETINLINNVYSKDFEMFGYQKIEA